MAHPLAEPTNADRAARGTTAITAYQCDGGVDDDRATAGRDLITDILHAITTDPAQARIHLDMAFDNYAAEITGTLNGKPEDTCPRHGGAWGDDITCEHCTTEHGHPRPRH